MYVDLFSFFDLCSFYDMTNDVLGLFFLAKKLNFHHGIIFICIVTLIMIISLHMFFSRNIFNFFFGKSSSSIPSILTADKYVFAPIHL